MLVIKKNLIVCLTVRIAYRPGTYFRSPLREFLCVFAPLR
jgi:hypothetical protein